ncbi:hypothetical protein DCS_04380 [Drechmeria coniospora]|uniref:Uncharacterized protein n=1 Tax=Drechmeria coniospora TaxID=98403 RepID=A0A151GK05_DRECN|nr:hypothetical protein DCS_04380 [Drechmeria coniospora]KYK57371.1 hypothetical protein DCS_04380 [Drechmeria coniospora]
MLWAVIRLTRTRRTKLVLHVAELLGRRLSFATAAVSGIYAPKPVQRVPIIMSQDPDDEAELESTGPAPSTFLVDHRGFPITTPEQDDEVIHAFIESIDSDAVCRLASRYNHCGPCRRTNLANPISALVSRSTQVPSGFFLERNTRIHVPRILSYGRDVKLSKNGAGTQMFLIADMIPGESLRKNDFLGAPEQHRRVFYSQLIDVLAESRALEFPVIGSLMPNPDGGRGEFSSTVLRQLFTPPSRITSHDSIKTKNGVHTDCQVLDEKCNMDGRCNLAPEKMVCCTSAETSAIGNPKLASCVGHLVRCLEEAIYTFHDIYAPNLYDRAIQDVTSEFLKEHETIVSEHRKQTMSMTNNQLATLKKRISEIMAAVDEERRELNQILAFLRNIPKESRQQLSNSAAGSKRARADMSGQTIDESGDYYERRRMEKEQAIGRMWEKIHDLQVEEIQLKKSIERDTRHCTA